MEYTVWFALLEEARLVDEISDIVAVETPASLGRPRMTLTGVTPALRAALQQLQGQGAAEQVLMGQVLGSDGMPGLAKLNQYLKKLEQYTLLSRHLYVDGALFASLRPLSIYYRYAENRIESGQEYVLSRFACIRNDQGRMLLECPLGHAEIHCHAPAAFAALHTLTTPSTMSTLAEKVPGLTEESARLIMNFLANAQALLPSIAGQGNPEAEDSVLGPWEFHDLFFHTRTRLGRHNHPYGGTFPFKDKFAPLPVIKPSMSEDIVPLYRPAIEQLQQDDRPFTAVLEQRSSVREQGDKPISLKQLGEFLYRTARVKRLSEEGGVSFRPHPAGGALHELEIYLVVGQCDGLPQGLYHYNPLAHQLHKVSDTNPQVNTLLRIAGTTGTLDRLPQVLLTITARFQRLQLKYQSMTYALILKNVGALYQTMYLVATAMGLAPCALGGGHADMFSQAAGLNYMAEASVGEFILGTRKDPTP